MTEPVKTGIFCSAWQAIEFLGGLSDTQFWLFHFGVKYYTPVIKFDKISTKMWINLNQWGLKQ